MPIQVKPDESLNEVLARLNLKAKPDLSSPLPGRRLIVPTKHEDGDPIPFTGTAGQVWEWLRYSGRIY
jgi:hypothetical protein